jgi:hypothetical protein
MPRVFDCILLDGELDALEARFRALEHIPEVTHVIAEAPVDHHGQQKPAWFQQDRERREGGRFAPWHGRWTHVLVGAHELPAGTPEAREAALRDFLAHGLSGGPGDVILHGPVTEIPDPATVRSLAAGTIGPPVTAGTTAACRYQDLGTFTELEEHRRRSA